MLPKLRGGFFEPSYVFFKDFPIKEIDIKNVNENKLKEEIIKFVDLLLQLNQQLLTEKLQTNIEQIKSRIVNSEEKVDQLVYELYQLTPEEIKLVEGDAHE